MDLAGKNILVTGGAGFIGSHLVDMLLSEDVAKVVVFDNFIRGGVHNLKEAMEDDRVAIFDVKGDLTRLDEVHKAVEGIDGVFHLASLCLPYCQKYPRSALDVNVAGTFNLLDACSKHDVKRVIFASSSSVYGNAVYSPMDEKHPFENRNFYGATKIAGEALFKAFFFEHGLEYLTLRFMNIYGPRQDYLGAYVGVIMGIIDRLGRNLPPLIYGDGSQSFDFVFVNDACRSLILAMQSSFSDAVYNISSGKQTSILKVCNKICQIMNKDVEIEFREVKDKTLVTDRVGSIDKAKQDLNFEAKTTLEDGLKQLIEWKETVGPVIV